MADLLDASTHWDAVKALLSASPAGNDVYDYGDVPGESSGNPGDLPEAFVVLSVSRRYAPPNNGRSAASGWRISCRHVAKTAADARLIGTWVTDALNEVRLSLEGVASTPITHESTTAVEPDDGMFSGLSQWTYAL
jgi:hypothetical protein